MSNGHPLRDPAGKCWTVLDRFARGPRTFPFGSAGPVSIDRRICAAVARIPVALPCRDAATTTDFGTASVELHEHLDGDSGLFLHNLQLRPGRSGRLTACLLPILKRLDT